MAWSLLSPIAFALALYLPYWFIAPRVHVGLWQVCVNNYCQFHYSATWMVFLQRIFLLAATVMGFVCARTAYRAYRYRTDNFVRSRAQRSIVVCMIQALIVVGVQILGTFLDLHLKPLPIDWVYIHGCLRSPAFLITVGGILCQFIALGTMPRDGWIARRRTLFLQSPRAAAAGGYRPPAYQPLAQVPMQPLEVAQQDVQVHGVPNLINLIIAVDMSGSMEGRWESVKRGVFEAASLLSDVDVITILPFNESVAVIGPAPKARFPFSEFFSIAPSGGTHLYDAILRSLVIGMELHKATDEVVPIPRTTYVVVMTDGDDQGSTATLSELCEAVRLINALRDFEVIFAGVDLPYGGRMALQTLGSVGDSDVQLTCRAGLSREYLPTFG